MGVDEYVFFKEATLRICGSLEIEKAMQDLLIYCSEFLPCSRIILSIRERSGVTGAFSIIADVDVNGVVTRNRTVVMPDEISLFERELYEAEAISEDPHGLGYMVDPRKISSVPFPDRASPQFSREIDNLTRVWSETGRVEPYVVRIDSDFASQVKDIYSQLFHINPKVDSALCLLVSLEGVSLGELVLIGELDTKFSDKHAALLKLLNDPIAIAIANSIRYRNLVQLKDSLADQKRFLEDELRDLTEDEIVGADFGLKHTMSLVSQVAQGDSPVLLLGETGVGKELIANAIHFSSSRRSGPYIKVNCGAIPANLMDSELFGHEKGAFTGAIARKKGRFERAHEGTIFLDEIGELNQDAQVRLLRVLQEKEIERVGATESIKVDIRVIAATHRDLESMVSQGSFREDLYYRLNVFPIEIPPLRDRLVDIPALAAHFLTKKTREMKLIRPPAFAPHALDQLLSYDWPGNIRELENAIERAVITCGGKPISFEYLSKPREPRKALPSGSPENEIAPLDAVVARHIREALEAADGRVNGPGGAADLLGINPSTLRKRMRKLGIPYGRKAVGAAAG